MAGERGRGGADAGQTAAEAPPLLPVLTLTEEELLVLTDDDLGVVPPRLRLPDTTEGAELVRTVALRALMARGLVSPLPRATSILGAEAAGSADGVGWEAAEPLGLTLSLRALATAVLGLQRVLGPRVEEVPAGRADETESTTATRYLHLHPQIAVIEDVTTDGMHSLLTVLPDRFDDAVSDFIRPPEAVPGTGKPRRLASTGDTAVADLLTSLGHPTVLVEAAVLSGPAPVSQMLALGPGGCFRSADSIVYHPVDPDAAIADLVRSALGGS